MTSYAYDFLLWFLNVLHGCPVLPTSVFSRQQEQASVLWHGCFYVARNVGVRAVYWFFKDHLSALKIFLVISHFASLLLPIWETNREYFPSD